jgi:drug/metabolite transporter (DMT)-like permease
LATAPKLVSTLLVSHRGQSQVALQISPDISLWFALLRLDATVRKGLFLCAMAGLLDCLGQLGYVLSATQGQMSVAAALVAMYPAVSVGLAIWILKERICPMQLAGLVAGLGSILLLSQ